MPGELFSAMTYGSISYNAHAESWPARRRRSGPTTTPGREASIRIYTAMANHTRLYRWRPAGLACIQDYLDSWRGR